MVVIEVRIELDDPDGTTSIVNATIIRNLQTWNFNLSDDDGDGILTINENADPNGDGDPADALDTDLDGIPDYLDNM